MSVPEGINQAANAVADSLDAAVFVYSGPIDHEGYGGLIKTIAPSKEQPPRPNVILLLTTYGGTASRAYLIARLLQNLAQEQFYLCVPALCKSAGTLIALGASKIYMPTISELGPLDAQIRRRGEIGQRRSGMVVQTALDGLADETFKVFERVMLRITRRSGHAISFDAASRVAAKVAVGVMAPVYAQVKPELLGEDLRDLSVATAYGNRLIQYGGNATEEAIKHLVEGYPEHGFIIDCEEAKGLFKSVEEPTEEINALMMALGDIVYEEQSPHIILRLDGDFEQKEVDDDGTESGGDKTSRVDRGRKAKGRGDNPGGRKAKDTSRPDNGNGEPGQKTDRDA